MQLNGQSQSASRIYRYTAHFALACIITLVAFWVFGFSLKQEVAIPAMLVLLLISMGVATFFISLHADAGEAILLLYLMEEEFSVRRKTSETTSKYKEIDQEVDKFYLTHPSNEVKKP